MKHLLLPVFFALAACLPAFAQSPKLPAGAQPVVQKIEKFEGGLINWTEGYIEVSGTSIFNPKFERKRQQLEMAKRGAVVVAKANLLEIVQGIHVRSESKVEDFMAESYKIEAEVKGVVKGARTVATQEEADAVTVTVRMPLAGVDGLAPILIDDVLKKPDPIPDTPPAKPAPPTKLPPVDGGGDEAKPAPPSGDPAPGTGFVPDDAPQFVLDFKGQKFDPRLFPVIVDEQGNVVFDYAKVYAQYGGQIATYVDLSKKLAEDLNWRKGVEIIEAVQDPNGKIRVDTAKHPKLNNFLKKAWTVGKVALPVLLGLL